MVRRFTGQADERSVVELLEPRLYLALVPGVWSELGFRGASGGGVTYDTNESTYPDMAVDNNGYPMVVYEDYNPYGIGQVQQGPYFRVTKYNGLAWYNLGGVLNTVQGPFIVDAGHDAVIALDKHTGTPYVAWTSGTRGAPSPADEIYLSYWDGTRWRGLAGLPADNVSNDGVTSGEVSLAVGEDSRPVVAYKAYDESTNDFDIVVKKWDGQAWVELTSGRTFGRTVGGLATYYGGGVSNDVFDSFDPSIAIGPDNAPIVAWASRGFGQDAEIYVRRWNGTMWELMGTGSASEPNQDPVQGISNNTTESRAPRVLIAQDPANLTSTKILIGWTDYFDWLNKTDFALYIRQWDPVAHTWQEFAPGSATGVGIMGQLSQTVAEVDWAIGINPVFKTIEPMIAYTDLGRGHVQVAEDTGAGPVWTPLSFEVNPRVPMVSTPRVERAPDGTVVVAYTSNPTFGSSTPWDAYTPDLGADRVLDSEVMVQSFSVANDDWTEYGPGADELGGIENSVGDPGLTYNSPPQLGTDAFGNPVMVYLHRVEDSGDSNDHLAGHLEMRILKYDEVTNTWSNYGIAPVISEIADYNDPALNLPFREGLDWYGDMLLIAADPRATSTMDGMPIIAYVDSKDVNSGAATITVYGLDDMGTQDPSDDTWRALGGDVAYVSTPGYTLDQVAVVSWDEHKVVLFWREVNPAGSVAGLHQFIYDGTNLDPTGTVTGDSRIFSQLWLPDDPADPFTGNWDGYGQGGPWDMSDELGTNYVDFAPSTVIDNTGQLILSFSAGIPRTVYSGYKDTWNAQGYIKKDVYIPALENAVFTAACTYDPVLGTYTWSTLGAWAPMTIGGTRSYGSAMNPSVALGYQAGPMVAWSDENTTTNMADPISMLPVWNPQIPPFADLDVFEILIAVKWDVTNSEIWESTFEPGLGFQWALQVSNNTANGHVAVMPSASGNGSQLPVVTWTDADPGTSGYYIYTHYIYTAHVTGTAFNGWELTADNAGHYVTGDLSLGVETSIVDPVIRPWATFDPREYYQDTTRYTDTTTDWLQVGGVTLARGDFGSTGLQPGTESIFAARHDINDDYWWGFYVNGSTGATSDSGWGLSGDVTNGRLNPWCAGVMSDVIIHTVGTGSSMASQPVVIWMNAYEDSIYGREFKHIGNLPYMQVIESSGTVNDNILDFGSMYYNVVGQRTFTIANQGSGELVIYSIDLDAPGDFAFYDVLGRPLVVDADHPLRIAANSSVAVVVHSLSNELGPFYHYMSIDSNDPRYQYGEMVELRGSRYNNSQIYIEEKAGIWDDNVVPFNIVRYGTIATRSFWIHNLGTDQLTISQFTVGGLDRNFVPWTRAADYVLGQTGQQNIDGIGGVDNSQQAAQSFKVAGDQRLYKVMLYLGRTGDPTDNIYVRIETSDINGKPSGVAIADGVSRLVSASEVDPGDTGQLNFYNLVFDQQPLLQNGVTYWIVLYRDGAQDAANNVFWGYDDQGGYSNGQFAVRKAAGWDTANYAAVDGLFVVGATLSGAVIPGGDALAVNVDFANSTSFDNIPIIITMTQQGSGIRNETQTVTIDQTKVAAAGTFTLTFNGQTTEDIAYHASAQEVQAALEALSTIGAGNVLVGGLPGQWTVTFRGALGNMNVPDLTATSSVKEVRDVTAYAVIRHDDYGLHGTPPATTADPIIVTFTANKPDFETVYTVAANGWDPSIGANAVSWTEPKGIFSLDLDYPDPAAGAMPANISGLNGIRSKTDGDYIVWEENSAIWMYQISTGLTTDLTGAIFGNERSVNIDEGRIVYASDATGSWNIDMMDLNDPLHPVTHIPEAIVGAVDFWPDIDGDLIVWRGVLNAGGPNPGAISGNGYQTGEDNNFNKGIFAYHIPAAGQTSVPFQVTSGVSNTIVGAQIPSVSDGRIVWTENVGGAWQLHYSDTETSTAGVILDRAYPISAIPSVDASMVSWAAQTNYPQANANWDLYAYYFSLRPGEVEGGPAIRGRIFQLTYQRNMSRINPSTYGRLMVFQESTTAPGVWQIKYGTIPGVPNVLITENSNIPNDKVLEYGTVYRGIPKTMTVTLANNGTDDAIISKLSYSDLHVFVMLPDGSLLPDNYLLPFGQSVVLSIVIDPDVNPAIDPASGPQQSVITMTTDDWDNPIKTITLNYNVAWPAELVANPPTTTGTLITGRTVHVSAVVDNAGLGDSGVFTGQFYFDGVAVTPLINVGPIVAGGSATVEADILLPLLADGPHALSFTADVGDVVEEVNENNNTAVTTLNILPSWDPAAILPLTVPATISNGSLFTLTGTIKNLGDRVAPDFQYAFYLSSSPTANVTTDMELYRGTVSGLAPNQVVTVTGNIQPLTRAQLPPDGVYYIVLVVDPNQAITEFDRTNDSQAAATNILMVEHAPTLTRILPLTGAFEDTPFTITYNMLIAAADESDLELNDVISFRITSVDNGTLTINGQPVIAGTTIIGPTDSVVWSPTLNENGIIGGFHVLATDGILDSATPVQVYIDVTPVNDLPTLTAITPLLGTKGVPITITYGQLIAGGDEFDVEGSLLTFRIMQVLNGTLTWLDGTPVTPGVTTIGPGATDAPAVIWTSSAKAAGTVNAFAVAAFDGTDLSTPPVPVRVIVNNTPTLTTIRPLSGAFEDTDFPITYEMLSAASNKFDADGDVLTFIINSVTTGTLTKNGAAVVPGVTTLAPGEMVIWHPAANAFSTGTPPAPLNAFTVTVTDGKATTVSPVQVQVIVTAVNDNPNLTNMNTLLGATEDTPFNVTYAALFAASNATDIEGSPISFVIESVTANGTLTIGGVPVVPGVTALSTGQTMVWTPAANANGVLNAFTVSASDGQLLSGGPSVMVKVDVAPVNDRPVGANQTVGLNEDATLDITLGGSDIETAWASLLYNVPARSAHGTLTKVSQGVYRYVPDTDFNGQDTFTYTITDTGDPAGTAGNVLPSNANTVSIHVGQQQYFDSRFPARYLDSDGDMVTVTMRGLGSGWVYFPSAGPVDASGIVLDGSTSTTLSITVKSPTRGKLPSTTMQYIEAHGGIKSITGTTTDLVGGATGGHITVTAPSPGATNAWKMTVRSVSDVGMQSELPISTLTATQWTETAGAIQSMSAPWITTLLIKGNSKMGLSGDFGADLTLTGAGATGLGLSKMSVAGRVLDVDLAANAGGIGTITTKSWADGSVRGSWIKTLKVAGDFNADVTTTGVGAPLYALASAVIGGNMTGSVWGITGDVNLVKASGFAQDVTFRASNRVNSIILGASRSSDFFAGVSPAVVGHAGAAGDFTNPGAMLKSFKVLGNIPGSGFSDSNVSASGLGVLSILNGDFGLGGVWSLATPASSNVPGGFVHVL